MKKNNKKKEPELVIHSVIPKFIYQQCPNCKGYCSTGYNRIPCRPCNEKGVLEIPVERSKDEVYRDH
jgi:hypothetical protein